MVLNTFEAALKLSHLHLSTFRFISLFKLKTSRTALSLQKFEILIQKVEMQSYD